MKIGAGIVPTNKKNNKIELEAIIKKPLQRDSKNVIEIPIHANKTISKAQPKEQEER